MMQADVITLRRIATSRPDEPGWQVVPALCDEIEALRLDLERQSRRGDYFERDAALLREERTQLRIDLAEKHEAFIRWRAIANGGAVRGHVHDRDGDLDRSVCAICHDAYVECAGCGVYLCRCTREGRSS